jgi:uncharacterized protein (TIGR02145 family)
VPENFNDIHGTVNSVGGTPVSDAQVNVVTPTLGTGITYTNAEGVFSGRLPKNQLLTLNVYLTCTTNSDWVLAHSESINSQTQGLTSSITASLESNYPITGTVVNCQNQPVESGYVKMGSQVFSSREAGLFTIQTCAVGEHVIRGYDTSIADSLNASALAMVQVGVDGINIGDLQTCTEFFGIVSDIDGHIYPTLHIGSQFWMTENLRSSSYANGEPILHVTDSTAWAQLADGAWCNYNNNVAYDSLYGKLYNWYTTVDPRGLCPTGWHIPNDLEWNTLIELLDPDHNPTVIGIQSTIAGGKMKAVFGWDLPNIDASNESGFNGLPGGHRLQDSSFDFAGQYGLWWSSSESSSTQALRRGLNFFNGDVLRNYFSKQRGYSIRCIKD